MRSSTSGIVGGFQFLRSIFREGENTRDDPLCELHVFLSLLIVRRVYHSNTCSTLLISGTQTSEERKFEITVVGAPDTRSYCNNASLHVGSKICAFSATCSAPVTEKANPVCPYATAR